MLAKKLFNRMCVLIFLFVLIKDEIEPDIDVRN